MDEQLEFGFMQEQQKDWVALTSHLQAQVHANAFQKGFWSLAEDQTIDDVFPAKLALIHSEVTEALEAHRTYRPKKEIAEELADIVIRVMDTAYALGVNIGEAVMAKHRDNIGRPYLHGNKRY